MRKVITYGTYDLLHHGHVRLLERAKALGDYLIVGVTSEGFDKVRGKINVKQPLMERIEAVKALGIADEVIVEEYEGQKIDDIVRYGVDVFTVGSDWVGYFDYLEEYCEVVYLDRTQGVSSTELRAESGRLRMGFVGDSAIVLKHVDEARFVNGLEASGLFTSNGAIAAVAVEKGVPVSADFRSMLESVDAVYVASHPFKHEEHVEMALKLGKHVLCEAPMALSTAGFDRLVCAADERGLILMDGLKTAYSTAYHRLKLLVKSGRIGQVVSVDATCTSLKDLLDPDGPSEKWNSMCAWGPAAMLPVFQLLGTQLDGVSISSRTLEDDRAFDLFTKIDFAYPHAVATVKVGKGVKSEGELVISGTKGYVYVPAPWWKTDYFELRYEDPADNRRFFYQLNGEGIRYELVSFARAVDEKCVSELYLDRNCSRTIVGVIEQFQNGDVDYWL